MCSCYFYFENLICRKAAVDGYFISPRYNLAVNCISLCLDNDRAGLSGMEKIREALKEDAELSRRVRVVVDNPPPDFGGKDYNELLQKTAARYAAAKREKTKPGCGMEK